MLSPSTERLFYNTRGGIVAAEDFFDSPLGQSVVKTELVSKYFKAWADIVIGPAKRFSGGRIAYIDLFSGPGRYDDGTESTPLHVLKRAIADVDLRQHLVTQFNDKNPQFVESLKASIAELPGIETLRFQPRITGLEVGRDLVKVLEGSRQVPTLFFVDPWGYKGLSLDLIGSAIRSWGCDCIFFFNYNRVNPAVSNPAVDERMNELFGAARAESLKHRVERLSTSDREATIVNDLAEALQQVGGQYVLPFTFRSPQGERTSHHIIFVSKHFRGYHVMKEVMAGLSSSESGGVKSFDYTPTGSTQLRLLDGLNQPHSVARLREELSGHFANRTIRVIEIYESHSVGTPYIKKNYKDAIKQLEVEERVTVDIPAPKRIRKGEVTLADSRLVTFLPPKGSNSDG